MDPNQLFSISFVIESQKYLQHSIHLIHLNNRQTLRETWANTTEFNYSKFAMLHSHLNGTYLPINDENWRNYTIDNDHDMDDVSRANFRIRVVFLVGQTENAAIQKRIVHETQAYNDMIQESFSDSYYNLTIKSVMMLKWVVNNGCEGKGELFQKHFRRLKSNRLFLLNFQ